MSMKENLLLWAEGVEKADGGDNVGALEKFSYITEPFARIYFNMAAIYLRKGDTSQAEMYLHRTVEKDPHMAIGYFLRAAVYLQHGQYDNALTDCTTCLTKLRGNLLIDYKQLGMMHKLYACEVHYNMAYAHCQQSNNTEALSHMKKAKKMFEEIGESRHQIIPSALESLKAGQSFKPFRLPNGSPLFKPPKSKTENLDRKNFLGQSKVVSSVQYNDSYTGFVGIQDKSPSSSPQPAKRTTSSGGKPPKPSQPPPQLKVSGGSTGSKLPTAAKHSSDWNADNFKPSEVLKQQKRPISPAGMVDNPAFGGKQGKKSTDISSSSDTTATTVPSHLTIKVHYNSTRAIRVSKETSFVELLKMVCKKFEMPDKSLTLWYKHNDQLTEIKNEIQYKNSKTKLEDGIRLVLWAYEAKSAVPVATKPAVPVKPAKVEVLRFVQALYDYTAQQDGDLSIKEGDRIAVTCEINDEWLEGKLRGVNGIFPKSYVKNM